MRCSSLTAFEIHTTTTHEARRPRHPNRTIEPWPHSLTHRQTHRPTNRLTDPQTDSPAHRLTDPQTRRPTNRLTHPQTDSPTYKPIHRSTDSPAHKQTHRPTNRLTVPQINSPSHIQTHRPTNGFTGPQTDSLTYKQTQWLTNSLTIHRHIGTRTAPPTQALSDPLRDSSTTTIDDNHRPTNGPTGTWTCRPTDPRTNVRKHNPKQNNNNKTIEKQKTNKKTC